VLYSGYQVGKRLGWWRHAAPLFQKLSEKLAVFSLKPNPRLAAQPLPREIPLAFVEVSPEQAAAEPPKDPKFYSARNSVAANPEIKVASDKPNLDGQQDKVIKTFDVLKPQPPAPPQDPAPQPEQVGAQPKPAPGDLALAKPQLISPTLQGQADRETGEAEKAVRSRPRTLTEARQRAGIQGQKMKQEGGVPNLKLVQSVDAKATAFGEYDYLVFQAISDRWHALIAENDFVRQPGRVELTFRLYYDGRVTDLKVESNTVSDLLSLVCEKAVTDPAPFNRWPAELRRLVGRDFRDIKITFWYL
jgi:hypothetical protein